MSYTILHLPSATKVIDGRSTDNHIIPLSFETFEEAKKYLKVWFFTPITADDKCRNTYEIFGDSNGFDDSIPHYLLEIVEED